MDVRFYYRSYALLLRYSVMLLSDFETIRTGASKVLEMYGDISADKPITFSPPK